MAPTTPADCTLLIGLPLTRDQFLADLGPNDALRFAPWVKRQNECSDEFAWTLFAPSAAAARRACDRVAGAGVRVHRRAGLRELRRAFRDSAVVTLVSHLLLSSLTEEDVDDPEGLHQGVLHHQDTLVAALRGRLRAVLGPPPWDRRELLAAIEAVTVRSMAAYQEEHPFVSEDYREADIPDEHFNRVAFECLFGEAIRPSRLLELCDGMHTVRELIDAIPPDWTGVLDLTLCNSAVLARWIKRERPHCKIISSRSAAFLDVRMIRFLLVIEGLTRRPRPFVEMVGIVHSVKLEGALS